MLSNEIKRLKMKKIKFENLGKNHEIRHLPTNHPNAVVHSVKVLNQGAL